MRHILPLLLLLCCAQALQIIEPQDIASNSTISSPFFNKFLGSQDRSIATTGPLSWARVSKACDLPNHEVDGHIVLLDRLTLEDSRASLLRKAVRCLEERGALGIVRIQPDTEYPGSLFNFNDGSGHVGTIPVLCVGKSALRDAKEHVINGVRVIVRLGVSTSIWERIYSSPLFVTTWHVILVILNVCVGIMALLGLASHLHKQLYENPPPRLHFASVLMVGCVLQIFGAIVRVSYCAWCPIISNPNANAYVAQTLLVCAPLSEVYGNVAATIIYLRWGVFGEHRNERLIQQVLLFCCAVVLFFTIYLAVLTARYSIPLIFTTVILVFFFFVNACAAASFVYNGNKFVRMMRRTSNTIGNLSQQRSLFCLRTLRWIQTGGAVQVTHVIFVCLMLAFSENPYGLVVLATAHFAFLTIGAASHAIAFSPELGGRAMFLLRQWFGFVRPTPPPAAAHTTTPPDKERSVTSRTARQASACVLWG